MHDITNPSIFRIVGILSDLARLDGMYEGSIRCIRGNILELLEPRMGHVRSVRMEISTRKLYIENLLEQDQVKESKRAVTQAQVDAYERVLFLLEELQ
jgi:hypothetical protein